MNINFKIVLKKLNILLVLFLIAFILDLILFTFLPKVTIDYKEEQSYRFPYNEYSFTRLFNEEKKEVKKKEKNEYRNYSPLSQVELTAVYAKAKAKGWVVIEERATRKTYVLALNDSFKGHVLKEVYKTHVFFEKNGTKFKVEMKKDKLNFKLKKKKD